jgi:hypothetical protein
MVWHCVGTSVIGKSHIDSGIECQDFHSFRISKDQLWAALVVCDGAGSAKRSAESAATVANFFSKSLLNLAETLDHKPPGEWINDYVIQSILDIRSKLRDAAQSDTLAQFHTTLVASLIGPHGGFAIHIGDGAIFTGNIKKDKTSGNTNLDDGLFISAPHNGEYANETFFITEPGWIKNLRITPISKCDWLMLCSDGGASLTLNHDCSALRPEFFVPLVTGIKNENDASRENFLYEAVATDKTWALTNDDKTLLFCFSDAVISSEDKLSVNAGEVKKPAHVVSATQVDKYASDSQSSPHISLTPVKNKNSPKNVKPNGRGLFVYIRYLLLLLIATALAAFVYFGAQLDFVKKHFSSSVEQNVEVDKPKQEEVAPSEEQEKPKPGLPSEEIKKSIQNKQKTQKI